MKTYIYDDEGNTIGETITYPTPIPSKSKNIAIVIGHDADRQGAYGSEGISEWKFNDDLISEMVFDRMLPRKHKYFVFYRSADMDSYTSKMIDLHQRMDSIGIDISIELHFNATGDSSVNGNEALFCSSAGREIAKKLDDAFDILDNRERGIKKVARNERGGGFCCRGKSLAIISEPFFASEQYRFVRGGDQREKLKEAYQTFFESI